MREDRRPTGGGSSIGSSNRDSGCQIKVPVEQWTERIVLPVEAIAQDGAEFFVFEANGDHFDRRAVHVEYRDQDWVVIANDGALQPAVWRRRRPIRCNWR